MRDKFTSAQVNKSLVSWELLMTVREAEEVLYIYFDAITVSAKRSFDAQVEITHLMAEE